MQLIDTHAHLYLKEYRDDQDEMIQRAIEQGVAKMLIPHIDSRTSGDLHVLCDKYPDHLFPMMGLHPTSVKENYKEELELVEKQLANGKYCAVGEAGIDLYWDVTFRKEQEIAFRHQIDLAGQYELPLVIHTRNSLEEVIKVIKSDNRRKKRGVFHCFPGNIEQAEEVVGLGFYLGIGGVVTYKNSLMSKVVAAIDLKHLLLETDAPFLTPVPKRGMRNESAFVYYIAQKIAEIKGVDIEEVARITTLNAMELFLPAGNLSTQNDQ
ncbi:MAG: TatD family hydrolase [Bacteroidetes bacterium]|nr:TatD family hydrolase [Bacteroidota bacterium]